MPCLLILHSVLALPINGPLQLGRAVVCGCLVAMVGQEVLWWFGLVWVNAKWGGGVSAKCEVMGFCLKLATSKKGGGGLPLLRATEIFQNAPRGVTLDVHKCVFVHFLGMQKEIWGFLASKVTDLRMLT